MAAIWRWRLLVPAHRIVFSLRGDTLIEMTGAGPAETFLGYREMGGWVPGMIAWPNTVLLEGAEPIVVDPGYQTQGDMLVGALAARDLAPTDIRTVVMTHLHYDHITAVQQLGAIDLFVHADELETPYAKRQRGYLDDATVHALEGTRGEIRPGLRWMHTPGHSPGHIAVLVDTADGLVAIAGDTMGPRPEWFAEMNPPAGLPERDAHLDAYRRLRELSPHVIIPGHTAPIHLS